MPWLCTDCDEKEKGTGWPTSRLQNGKARQVGGIGIYPDEATIYFQGRQSGRVSKAWEVWKKEGKAVEEGRGLVDSYCGKEKGGRRTGEGKENEKLVCVFKNK